MSTQAQINTLKTQIKSGKSKSDLQTIREYLKHKDGMSSLDLEQTLGMIHQTFSARLSDLVRKGEVYYKGTSKMFTSEHSIIFYEHDKAVQRVRAFLIREVAYIKAVKKLRSFEDMLNIDLVILLDVELNK